MTKDNTSSNKLYKLLLALLSCVLGLSFLFMMLKDVSSTNWYQSRFHGWQTITAEVSGFTTSPEKRSTPAYYPIYHYIVDGQTYQGFSDLYQDEVPKSGETISILYNPKSPEQSQYKNDIPIPILVLMPLLGFLLFMALAAGSLYQAFNPLQEPKPQPKAAKSISIVEGTVRKENLIVTFVSLSMVMIVLTYICITETGQFKALFYGWKTTSAQVIDYDVYNRGRRGLSFYSSIYQYQVDGVAYEGHSVIAKFTQPKIQSQISIAYNPEYPYQSASSENYHIFYLVFFPGFSLLLVGKSLSLIIAAWIKKASLAQARRLGLVYDGYIIDVIPAEQFREYNPLHEIWLEFDINQVPYQTSICLPLREHHFISYSQNPRPIPVYVDPHDDSQFLIDDNDIYAITNQVQIS
ncbi:DUF3592 domain-containing protein [Streptococcus sanguinis]|uniref:DUF3592 domain-containing protein n=1 Tax=Streptococcus sanguinis TaxID=1305 RepID=UPI001CBBF66A|nr:DUF3592 domain-containing protein [Streptococcus sanguinis]MBZ2066592.1 DUF3592 domain-containing protein [Streptococcus sanguinis]